MDKRVVMVKGLDGVIKCDHDWVTHASGGMHFNGEPWDNIKEEIICMKCGADYKPEPQEENTIEELPI